MKSYYKYILALLCCVPFLLIRGFEASLFYDPFIAYFHDDFYNIEIPQYDTFKLVLNHFFRFGLNTAITVLIVYILFKKRSACLFALTFCVFFFILLLAVYLVLIQNYLPAYYYSAFTVRRFIIQPLFLFIILPALYFQQQKEKES